jgi:iron complex transport system ATP-binding protein
LSLHVQGLTYAYGKVPVLHDVSLVPLPRGEITALVGPNGSGKSTLMRCLAGLQRPQAGALTLDDRPLTGRHRIAYLPQAYGTNARLTVMESVLVALKQGSSWKVEAGEMRLVEGVLAELELGDLAQRMLPMLSGGQQQRAAIAQALVREPDVLLLDEPTSALDLRHQLAVMGTIAAITRRRRLVTVVSLHDLNLAMRFAARLVMLADGRIAVDDEPARALADPRIGQAYGVTLSLEAARSGRHLVDADLAIHSRR